MQAAEATVSTFPPCLHCGNSVPRGRSAQFCCRGCETVFGLLKDRGLDRYYQLRALDPRPAPSPAPAETGETFTYLDDEDFLRLYCPETFPAEAPARDVRTTTPARRRMRFYLEGAHCAACVWLTEKLPDFVPRVRSARLNLARSVMSVELEPGGSFASVARELSRLGYVPHPVRPEDIDPLQKAADHRLLRQVAIAGAATGNIMLLAASLYA